MCQEVFWEAVSQVTQDRPKKYKLEQSIAQGYTHTHLPHRSFGLNPAACKLRHRLCLGKYTNHSISIITSMSLCLSHACLRACRDAQLVFGHEQKMPLGVLPSLSPKLGQSHRIVNPMVKPKQTPEAKQGFLENASETPCFMASSAAGFKKERQFKDSRVKRES